MTAMKRKGDLKTELLEALGLVLANARKAHKSAVEGATHGEARQENDKDTRGLEQSYVARGQALRIAAVEAEIADVRSLELYEKPRVGLGSLVTVEENESTRCYFMAPHGGGVALDRGKVVVVTPRSPLGQALLGKQVGDECEVVLQGAKRALQIVRHG